ncbi:PAS factor [Vibrio coralliirubri]|nr:PAS factor [Vibrio coralliirubri]
MIKRRMNTTTTLVYDTLKSLAAHAPEQHAEIRQRLYEQLGLPFNKQLSLYANVLGPISSGKLAGCDNIDKAVELALDVLEGRNK